MNNIIYSLWFYYFLDKVLVYPSTYFIGLNGMPIDILAGDIKLEDFLEKLEKVVQVKVLYIIIRNSLMTNTLLG